MNVREEPCNSQNSCDGGGSTAKIIKITIRLFLFTASNCDYAVLQHKEIIYKNVDYVRQWEDNKEKQLQKCQNGGSVGCHTKTKIFPLDSSFLLTHKNIVLQHM